MQFFTKVPISVSKHPINYQSKIVSVGSCFAANMGEKLNFYKFQNTTNPFGIIFNPYSIEKLIRRAIQRNMYTESDIFFHNERWHCFEVHSELSHSDKNIFLKNLNGILVSFYKEILTASHFIITLGTSWVYRTITTEKNVANCHKVPQKQFTKHLLSTSEISNSLNSLLNLVLEINPECQFIFTVSPVRHIKDGFVENQVSKSHLISALYTVSQKRPQVVSYFPSYEITMDELRDYRFYSEDLLHPNTTAIDYIWSRFIKSNVDETSFSTMNEIETIQKGLLHRSFNPESISHQNFLTKLDEKILKLQQQYSFISFKKV